MKKAVRLTLTGNLQSMFSKKYIKDNADSNNVKGFLRTLEDSRIEVFLEGSSDDVDAMIAVCSKGPSYTVIRNVEMKPERLQDFKDFKIFGF